MTNSVITKRINIFVLMLLIVGQTILTPIASAGAVLAEGEPEEPDKDEEVKEEDSSVIGDDEDGTDGESPKEESKEEPKEVNKDALENLLKDVEKYEKDKYTADSFDEFVKAVTKGRNIFEANDATQDDVNDAVDDIKEAVEALQKKDLEPHGEQDSDNNNEVNDSNPEHDKEELNEDKQNITQSPGSGSSELMDQNYKDMDENNIKNVTFSPVPDQNGKVNVKNGETASFQFDLSDLEGGHPYGPGSTLTIPLPDVFKDFKARETTFVGDIEFNGQNVVFTFNENIVDEKGTGSATEDIYFKFTATIDNGASGLEKSVTIPGYGKLDLSFTPVNGTSVKKEPGQTKDSNGNIVDKNPDYFEWTVIVNTDLNATNGGFKDTLQPGHTFKQGDEVTVTELTMKANGTYDEGTSQKRAPDSSSDNEITLNLDTNKAYKITYKTYPEDPGNGGYKSYSNTAHYDDKSSSNFVSTNYDTGIKKTVSNPKISDLTTDWEIIVNENKRDLGNITVTDKWTTSGGSQGAKQELVGDVKVYEADGTTEATINFNFNQTENGIQDRQGFNIEFTNNVGTNTYVIKYTTKPTADTYIQENTTVSNNVSRSDNETTFKDSKRVTYNKTSFMLNKTTPAINYAKKKIDWKIVANQAKEELENPVFEDRFTNKNMTLKQDTLKVQVGNKELEDNEFTLEVLDNQEGFNIEIDGTVNEQVIITYTTDYDIRDYGSNTNVYKNDVSLKSGNNVPDISDSAERRSEQKPEQRDNGKKSGVYNYETKRFEWEVELNFNYNTLQNAVFEDFISNDPEQTIDPNSIEVVDGTISQDGYFQESNPVTPNNIEVNGNTLKVELGQISTPHKITYESYVTGDFIPEQHPDKLMVTNGATLKDGDEDNANWTKTVSVNYTDKLINKTGQQLKDAQNRNTAGIKWSFEFNYAQSDLKNIVITDDVGKDADGNPNQLYNENSFKVFPVTLSGTSDKDNFNAATVANDPLDPGEYELDVNVKNGTFTLKLPDGDGAYFVVYETVYLGAGNEEVKNQVAVQFENEDADETSAQGHYSFTNFTYSGGGNVIRVPFVVIKTDAATGQPMEDIEFTLYHKESDRALMSDKTDKDGVLDFGINFSESDYYLKEENLPNDYQDPGNIEFTLHRDNIEKNGPYTDYQIVEVENFAKDFDSNNVCPKFTLTVKDANEDPREDVKVKYVNTMTGKEIEVSDKTDADGEVTVSREDLPAGTYKVVEVDANGNKIADLGEIGVKYDSNNCEAIVQPDVCPNFTITVNDENNNPREEGVNVTIKDKDGKEFATGTTDSAGKINIPSKDLPAGDYEVYEGEIYLGDVEVSYLGNCEATLDTSKDEAGTCPTFTLTITDRSNNPRADVENITIEDSKGNKVSYEDSNGNTIDTFKTNSNGQIELPFVMKPGTYTVYEDGKRINTFEADTTCEASVKPRSSGGGGGWTPPTDPEEPKTCDAFTITVKQDGESVGADVELTLKSGTTEVDVTTGSNGKIVIDKDDLREGSYTVYDKDGNDVGTITVTYEEDKCNDEIDLVAPKVCENFTINVKYDGKPVTSGKYTFTSEDGQTTVIGTVDSNGKIVFDRIDLPSGKYKVTDEEGKTSSITIRYTDEDCETDIDLVTDEEEPVDPDDPDKEDPKDPSKPGKEDPKEDDDGSTKGDGDSKGDSGKEDGSMKGDGTGTKGDSDDSETGIKGAGTKASGGAGKGGIQVDGDGNKLPKTSTHIFNLAFIGIVLLVLGFILVYRRRTV